MRWIRRLFARHPRHAAAIDPPAVVVRLDIRTAAFDRAVTEAMARTLAAGQPYTS